MISSSTILVLVILLPLAGGGVTMLSKRSIASLVMVIIAALLAVYSLFFLSDWSLKFDWLPGIELGWRLDKIGRALIALVVFISALVHIFSLAYIKEVERPRYYLKLGFFTSAMIGLLASDHLILLFIFWELVGFASYLLIGFWYKKDSASESAKWAFIVNRIADMALLGAILAVGSTGSFFISELESIESFWIGLGLLIGAMGKSAQFPFSVWLPRAMTGPTPVSALIHAATMVAAGVYLLIRVGEYLPEVVLNITVVVGVVTAFYGAFCAMTQHDIKQVLAFSTISQLGYMFLAIGVGAVGGAFFHLWTHAFFKAGLFLVVGAVIHKSGTQDMRQMGGLKTFLKPLFLAHVMYSLALVGIPLFTGFMSKEGILVSAWVWASRLDLLGYTEAYLAFYFAIFTIFLTAFYMGRQILLVYFGDLRITRDIQSNISYKMSLPLIVLIGFSLWISQSLMPWSVQGWIVNFVGFKEAVHGSLVLTIASLASAVLGIMLSYSFFSPSGSKSLAYVSASVPSSGVGKASYFGLRLDKVYQRFFARGYLRLSQLLYWVDKNILDALVDLVGLTGVVFAKVITAVDRFIVDGFVNFIGYLVKAIGTAFARIQSSQVQTQLIWMIIGLILILITLLFF